MTSTAAGPVLVDQERLARWIDAHDAIIDELHDDLVRRAIVHLSALREDLLLVSAESGATLQVVNGG